MSARRRALAVVLLGSLLITGCGAPEPTPTAVPATATPTARAVTDTPLPPTATPAPPTETPTATPLPPIATPPPTATQPAPTVTPTGVAYEVTRGVRYGSASDQRLDLYLPDRASRQPPTLLVLNGTDAFLRHFAKLGYAGLAVQLSGGSFRQGVASGFCALAWTHAHAEAYGLDARYVVMVGGSIVGGQVATVGVADEPAPHMVDCPHSLPEGAALAGVIALAGTLDLVDRAAIDGSEPPFLLIHGEGDANVEPRESESFAEALEQAGVDVQLVLLPHASHSGVVSDPGTYEAIEEFLSRLTGLTGDCRVMAFVSGWDIYLMTVHATTDSEEAVGTGLRQLTTHRGRDAWPAWSPDGSQIAFMSERSGYWDLYVLDAEEGESSVRRLMSRANLAWEPAWSPDGASIAFGSLRNDNSDIYLVGVDGPDGGERRLTRHRDVDGYPCWSPDGSRIAFVSDRDGNWEIYVVDVGDREIHRLTNNAADDWDPDWSPDGTQIAFASRRDGNMEIYLLQVEETLRSEATGDSEPRRLTEHPADDMNPSWSPDGTTLAFHREEGGTSQIYLMDLVEALRSEGSGGPYLRKVTTDSLDAGNPVWRPDPPARPAYVPLFEAADCPFPEPNGHRIECGTLTVPEDRLLPQGPQVRLPVAVLRTNSPDPEPDPVFHLVGGPGGSLLDAVDFYLQAGGDDILKKRDYVLFNQRGTRYAEPYLGCPGLTALRREIAAQGLPLEERNRRELEFLLDCHADLLDQGINLTAYNSAESAADVRDLRLALGYQQINLYGISYGSRLALTVMRDHPQGIRSAILDGVFPPQANLNQEIALLVQRALDAVFEDCAADESCSHNYPGLEATFFRVVDQLNTQPMSWSLREGTIVVDGYAFVEAFFRLLYSTDAIPWIPNLIDQAGHGEYPEKSIFAAPDRESFGLGMHYAIWCREEMAFESLEEALALAADLPPVLGDLFADAFDWAVCAAWEAGVADPIENTAVVSEIPTLVLSGRYDPVTPPAWGRMAAETLVHSYVYELPNTAHGTMRTNQCALSLGLQFLDDPTTEPDASCLEELGSPAFR